MCLWQTSEQQKVKRLHINEVELTGPTKPSSEVLVKGLSLMGTPDGVTGMVCKSNYTNGQSTERISTVFQRISLLLTLSRCDQLQDQKHSPQRCSWSCLGGRSKLHQCYLSLCRSLQPRPSDRDKVSPPPAPHKPQLEGHSHNRRI